VTPAIAEVQAWVGCRNTKVQYWRAFSGIFGWRSAPMLDFHFEKDKSRFRDILPLFRIR
jgi:hypothetical protein